MSKIFSLAIAILWTLTIVLPLSAQNSPTRYWLNFYLYMDMRDWAMRMGKTKLLNRIDEAYVGGDWSRIK